MKVKIRSLKSLEKDYTWDDNKEYMWIKEDGCKFNDLMIKYCGKKIKITTDQHKTKDGWIITPHMVKKKYRKKLI